MKIKIVVLFTVLCACLALTACKVENKEGDSTTVVKPEKEKSTVEKTTVIDKTKGDHH